MALKGPRRGELAQLVTHHVLSDEHWHEDLSIMHVERVANEIWRDHGTTRPGLDWLL